MTSFDHEVAALARWIMAEPHHSDDSTAFVGALAERLTLAGVPLWRMRYALMTAEPEGVVDLGEQTLRGVRAPLRVFTVQQETAQFPGSPELG